MWQFKINDIRMKWFKVCLLIYVVGVCDLNAQEINRYWIQFSDKNGTAFSLDNPEDYLSEKALARRARQQIALDSTDLPPSQTYKDIIAENDMRVVSQSRWMNGILVEATEEQMLEISSLHFIDSTFLAAPGPVPSPVVNVQSNHWRKRQRMVNSDNQNQLLGIDVMHQYNFSGDNMLVAVLDGGFLGTESNDYFDHVFQNNQLVATYDFVHYTDRVFHSSDHGTRAFSTIGARGDNYIGGAPDADFMLIVTEDVATEFRVEEINWLLGAEMADSAGADVISTSLGYTVFNDESMNYTPGDLNGETAFISTAANNLSKKGIVGVFSVGNEGNIAWQTVATAADAKNILSVGAIDIRGNKASFSSTGPTVDGRIKPELSAIGYGAIVIDRTGNITTAYGTSFSAPQVAGLAAGLWQALPELTALELMALLKNTADNAANPTNELGFGVPNFQRAYNITHIAEQETEATGFLIYPNPFTDESVFLERKDDLEFQDLCVTIRDLNGRSLQELQLDGRNNRKWLVPLAHISPGIYTVSIQADEKAYQYKLVKN